MYFELYLSCIFVGRQHFLPLHDFKPLYQALNPAGPYAKSLTRTHVGDDNVWACSYCGVAYAAALRLWVDLFYYLYDLK